MLLLGSHASVVEMADILSGDEKKGGPTTLQSGAIVEELLWVPLAHCSQWNIAALQWVVGLAGKCLIWTTWAIGQLQTSSWFARARAVCDRRLQESEEFYVERGLRVVSETFEQRLLNHIKVQRPVFTFCVNLSWAVVSAGDRSDGNRADLPEPDQHLWFQP
jgi:hypothetical protein